MTANRGAGLIAPPREIVDAAKLRAGVDEICAVAANPAEIRAGMTALLRDALDAGRALIRRRMGETRRSGLMAARSIAYMTDRIIEIVFETASQTLHPAGNPTASERLCVVAVGGYGRGEMAPYSDVDLLFLTPYKQTAWGESVIETTLYTLWDLRLKVGYATRSVEDCLRLAKQDFTIRTALLEKRYLLGERELFDDLDARLWAGLFAKTGAGFVEAKLAERDRRHERSGGSRYLLEPNIKESKGGLRDLQTLIWIAKYLYHAEGMRDLVGKGVFTRAEAKTFLDASVYLWTVRCQLHYIAGRPQERLTFDMQVDMARELRYKSHGGLRAVERFMKHYFLNAKEVGDLTRIFCAALEAQHQKRRVGLGAMLRAFNRSARTVGAKGMKLRDGRIALNGPKVLRDDPINILRLFDVALESNALIHPTALRMITQNFKLIDDDLRASPAANAAFVHMLTTRRNPERALRRMNETGVLGRFLPEFGRIVCMMQFNMYHHYTVDEHTICALGVLSRIETGDLAGELPIASEILSGVVNRRILIVALLLHDIGKGRGGDHSMIGEEIACRVCPRLGLTEVETDSVAWLVRHHLLMSDIAQKRDISDPKTVRDFAGTVQSPERLKLLLVLTVCDIRAVGPGVWNNWKAQLLRQLYWDARDVLTGGHANLTRGARQAAAEEALRARLTDWSAEKVDVYLARHYPPYWLGLDEATHEIHARMADAAGLDSAIASHFQPDPTRDATIACFYMPDHPGLFTRMAGAVSLAGASVVDARSFTTRDGMALSVFWLQDGEGRPYGTSRLTRLKRTIERTLKGEVIPREALRPRRKMKKREQSFTHSTQILIDNEASDLHTVVEVNTRDRPGLLYDLTRALAEANANIFSAIIATYGEHAVDVFYVRDLFGMKIASKNSQKAVEKKLIAAIERAAGDAERAA